MRFFDESLKAPHHRNTGHLYSLSRFPNIYVSRTISSISEKICIDANMTLRMKERGEGGGDGGGGGDGRQAV